MSGLTQRTESRGAAAVEASPDGHEAVPEDAPDRETTPARPTRRERGLSRRRLRYVRKLRELELRDLGGLVFDLYRFGVARDELVRTKLESLMSTDTELHELEERLDDRQPVRELREAGVGGACWRCGTLHGSDSRFCSSCGAGVVDGAQAAAQADRRQP